MHGRDVKTGEKWMMKSKFGRRGLIAGIASGVVFAVGGCASMLGRQRRAQNDRFEEFSEYVPEKLDVRTDLEQLEKWMPGAHLSEAHWVMQYRQKKREMLPSPDRPLWVNAVLVLDSETTKALAAVSTGKVDRLPGIYPDLRQYVPTGDVFSSVPKEKVDDIFDVDNMVQDDPNTTDVDRFGTDKVVVCAESNRLVLVATEYHM